MKNGIYTGALALVFLIVSLPMVAQNSADAAIGLSGCGPVNVRFDVKFDAKAPSGNHPVQPDPGKALVFFVEQDININVVTHTTRTDIDGRPMGATYGSSYFYFSVDPGVHHLCATTQFGSSDEDSQTAVAHFTAQAGGIYYFEMKNLSWIQSAQHDVSLFPLDSDEGKFLTGTLQLALSSRKK